MTNYVNKKTRTKRITKLLIEITILFMIIGGIAMANPCEEYRQLCETNECMEKGKIACYGYIAGLNEGGLND